MSEDEHSYLLILGGRYGVEFSGKEILKKISNDIYIYYDGHLECSTEDKKKLRDSKLSNLKSINLRIFFHKGGDFGEAGSRNAVLRELTDNFGKDFWELKNDQKIMPFSVGQAGSFDYIKAHFKNDDGILKLLGNNTQLLKDKLDKAWEAAWKEFYPADVFTSGDSDEAFNPFDISQKLLQELFPAYVSLRTLLLIDPASTEDLNKVVEEAKQTLNMTLNIFTSKPLPDDMEQGWIDALSGELKKHDKNSHEYRAIAGMILMLTGFSALSEAHTDWWHKEHVLGKEE